MKRNTVDLQVTIVNLTFPSFNERLFEITSTVALLRKKLPDRGWRCLSRWHTNVKKNSNFFFNKEHNLFYFSPHSTKLGHTKNDLFWNLSVEDMTGCRGEESIKKYQRKYFFKSKPLKVIRQLWSNYIWHNSFKVITCEATNILRYLAILFLLFLIRNIQFF